MANSNSSANPTTQAVPAANQVPWDQMPLYRAAIERHVAPGQPSSYVVPRRVGRSPDDVTGFIAGQAHWSKGNLPSILYMLRPPDSWREFKETRPGRLLNPDGSEVKEPFPEDPENAQAMRDLPILPLRIGTQEEEWYFEAVRRLDPRVRWVDITMRMKREDRPAQNAVQWRLSRGWREAMGMISWHITSRRGRDNLANDRVLSRLSAWQVQHNTTRGLTPGKINPQLPKSGTNWIEWPLSPSGKDWGCALKTTFTDVKRNRKKSKEDSDDSVSPSQLQATLATSSGATRPQWMIVGNTTQTYTLRPSNGKNRSRVTKKESELQAKSQLRPYGFSSAPSGQQTQSPYEVRPGDQVRAPTTNARQLSFYEQTFGSRSPSPELSGNNDSTLDWPQRSRGNRSPATATSNSTYVNPFDHKLYDRAAQDESDIPLNPRRPVSASATNPSLNKSARPTSAYFQPPNNTNRKRGPESGVPKEDLGQPRQFKKPRHSGQQDHPAVNFYDPMGEWAAENLSYYRQNQPPPAMAQRPSPPPPPPPHRGQVRVGDFAVHTNTQGRPMAARQAVNDPNIVGYQWIPVQGSDSRPRVQSNAIPQLSIPPRPRNPNLPTPPTSATQSSFASNSLASSAHPSQSSRSSTHEEGPMTAFLNKDAANYMLPMADSKSWKKGTH